jgi:phosphohistidine phosphatase SixA
LEAARAAGTTGLALVLLVRHARAGERDEWDGDDRLRPLDDRGRRQAEELVGLLSGYELDCILSSPALRCVQTLEPLAQARAIAIELREELSEEQQCGAGAALVRDLDGDVAISCHGGLSLSVCGEDQKKGEVLVLDGARVVDRVRAKGKS